VASFAAVAIAEKLGKPWVCTVIAPAAFLSAYDPPVPAMASWIVKARVFGPGLMRALWAVARKESLKWVRDVIDFRRELGLSTAKHPLFEGAYSPKVALALFSRHFAPPAPDWPPQVVLTGFPFHESRRPAPADLLQFMEAGPAPIVFTLGSSAVAAAGDFYRDSLEAVRRLGTRAVFLTGQFAQDLPDGLPASVFLAQYAPHQQIFPRAAAIVHQGGIGTTAQAMRSGRPMLVVPFAHDQYDNAARIQRIGAGEMLPRPRYSAAAAARALRRLVENPGYARTAAALGERIRSEDGVSACADALEASIRS
jgi:rhamnosyltransferase subunit B